MSTVLKAAFVSVILLITPGVSRERDTVRDGNWWIDQSEGYKLDYVVGFFDGVELGHKFSYRSDSPILLTRPVFTFRPSV